ncbi:membrane protein insertase YidC [Glycomyces artemisiae]|uniref:Membrane protein insertase YidC n=1 Tax=Glycomyces artemisiae TaxID=1076443 RepID=A0A2T0URU9_9ACTN|nr:membrane protein insertase YidC [Glycomyces artemisiae]PRY60651.1 YidC/Oxa1 family membrane protein insertase [Glycomyces artemisiae]
MEWAYNGVSWVLLRWHDLWSNVFGGDDNGFLQSDWAWVLAIVGVVITLRIILFPLFVKQIQSQRAMQKLAPEIKALQERYKNDRETLQKEMMELYRKEKANPLMGCLPILIQMPVFLALFHILRRPDPAQTMNINLYGWTDNDWSTYVHAKLFGAPFWSTFLTPADDLIPVDSSSLNVKLVAGILGALMILTTFLTTRQMILKTGWNEDPNQRMIQKVMLYGIPVIMVFSAGAFPIGVVIYWTINNLFSLAQQQYVLRKYPPPQQNTANAKPPKPGTKAHEKMLEEQRETEQRRKDLAPKPGQKPKQTGGAAKPASGSGVNGANVNGSGAAKSGPGAGKNLSRAERIARAKKVSGAQQASKKKKG